MIPVVESLDSCRPFVIAGLDPAIHHGPHIAR
jgi:hypothetical protein